MLWLQLNIWLAYREHRSGLVFRNKVLFEEELLVVPCISFSFKLESVLGLLIWEADVALCSRGVLFEPDSMLSNQLILLLLIYVIGEEILLRVRVRSQPFIETDARAVAYQQHSIIYIFVLTLFSFLLALWLLVKAILYFNFELSKATISNVRHLVTEAAVTSRILVYFNIVCLFFNTVTAER